MVFQNGPLSIRVIEERDLKLITKWLSDERVLEFYEGRDNPFDYERAKKVFMDTDEEEAKCIVEYANKPIGYIQFYEVDEETMKKYGYGQEIIYGIDQFIGEVDYWHQGIGTLLITSMTTFLLEEKQAKRVIMDPQIRNARAIRCYEKSGFRKVGELRAHELHEGVYQDCWLMEYSGGLPEG